MFKTLSAAALSLSIALGGFAPTPAVAGDREDLAKVLIGIGLLAAIASAADSAERDRRPATRSGDSNRWDRDAYRWNQNDYRWNQDNYRRDRERAVIEEPFRPLNPVERNRYGANRKVLPKQCVRTIDLDRGKRSFLMRDCLEDRGIRTLRLPVACERSIDVPGRKRDLEGWNRSCLQNRGYAIR